MNVAVAPNSGETIQLRDGNEFQSLHLERLEAPDIHQWSETLGLDWSAPQSEPWMELTFAL